MFTVYELVASHSHMITQSEQAVDCSCSHVYNLEPMNVPFIAEMVRGDNRTYCFRQILCCSWIFTSSYSLGSHFFSLSVFTTNSFRSHCYPILSCVCVWHAILILICTKHFSFSRQWNKQAGFPSAHKHWPSTWHAELLALRPACMLSHALLFATLWTV